MASLKQWLISKLPNCKGNQPRKIKVVVVGDPETGKTTLVSAMMGKQLAKYNINFHHTRFTYQGVEYRIELVDPESMDYRLYLDNRKRKYFQGTDACILTYRTDRKDTFEHLDMWRDAALAMFSIYGDSDRDEFPFLAVGTYETLPVEGPGAEEGRRTVPKVDVERWCRENNMDFIEICTQRHWKQMIDIGLRYCSALEIDVKEPVMDMVMKEVRRYEKFQQWQKEKRRQEQLELQREHREMQERVAAREERERQEEQEKEKLQQQRSEAVGQRSPSASQDSPRPVVHEQLQRSTGGRNQPSIVPGPERNQPSIIPGPTTANRRVLAGNPPTRNIKIPYQAPRNGNLKNHPVGPPPNRFRGPSYVGWSEDTDDSLPGLVSASQYKVLCSDFASAETSSGAQV